MWQLWIKYPQYVAADIKELLGVVDSIMPSNIYYHKSVVDGKDLALMSWIEIAQMMGLLTFQEREHIIMGIGPHI